MGNLSTNRKVQKTLIDHVDNSIISIRPDTLELRLTKLIERIDERVKYWSILVTSVSFAFPFLFSDIKAFSFWGWFNEHVLQILIYVVCGVAAFYSIYCLCSKKQETVGDFMDRLKEGSGVQ